MSYVGQYEEARNAHYLGRGAVYFTPPLLPTGGVNTAAYGLLWGDNWPATPEVPGQPHLPAGRFVGNARGLAIQPTLRRLTTSAWDARGNAIVESITVSLTLYGLGAANLADALHGVRSQYAALPITERVGTGGAGIEAGGMLFTRRLIDTSKPVTVTPSWAAWSEGVQWRRQSFGVELLAGVSGPVASSIAISYTPDGGAENIDAYADLALELGLVYTGVNVVDNRPVRVELYRARPALDGALTPLDDGIGAVTLNLSIEPVRTSPDRPAEWLRYTRGAYPLN
ncbi:MAG: hypothetical protein LBE78_12915 [Burkholderiaceae bacterium]|jgi:hypothetical protein|nr:hypothetical protein [Burkholderiaceae bacterium]